MERALLVPEPYLVVLAEQVRALGFDTRRARLRQCDASARCLDLHASSGVRGITRAPCGRRGLVVHLLSLIPQRRELRWECSEGCAGAVAFGRDGVEACLQSRHTLADSRFGARRVSRRDPAPLLFLARGTQLVVASRGDGLPFADVVDETFDLAIHADDLRGEVRARRRGRAEARLVPAQSAPAQL